MKDKFYLEKNGIYFDINNASNIDFSSVNSISIAESVIYQVDDREVCVHNTDAEHPILLDNDLSEGHLYIDPSYYEMHKNEVDNIIYNAIVLTKSDSVDISKELINDFNIRAVKNNSNINELGLDQYGDYALTSEVYNSLKGTHVKEIKTNNVVPELKDVMDPLIGYSKRPLLERYSYYDLLEANKISLYHPVNSDELPNLVYLNKDAEIEFKNEKFDNNEIIQLFSTLNQLGLKNKVLLNVDNKIKYNDLLFSNVELFQNANLFIRHNSNEYPIDKYIDYENRLNKMIEPALELSPLEKYLYAYNKVKQFKKYKENENDRLSARNVYDILDNEYMVCVGYAKLLTELLERLGIPAIDKSANVNVGFDYNPEDLVVANDKLARVGYHARVDVNLKDSKYGIDGIYIADPTWDNDMQNDYYTYALMTVTEYNSMNRENYNSYNFTQEILESLSYEEFCKRVNFANQRLNKSNKEKISKKLITNFNNLDENLKQKNSSYTKEKIIDLIGVSIKKELNKDIKYNFHVNGMSKDELIYNIANNVVSSYKFNSIEDDSEVIKLIEEELQSQKNKKQEDSLRNIFTDLLSFIKEIDIVFFKGLCDKFPRIAGTLYNIDEESILSVLPYIGEYIVSKNNNYIKGETLISAVAELYKLQGLNDEEVQKKLEETIKINKKKFQHSFPERTMIAADGTETIYVNEENKFDIGLGDDRNIKM